MTCDVRKGPGLEEKMVASHTSRALQSIFFTTERYQKLGSISGRESAPRLPPSLARSLVFPSAMTATTSTVLGSSSSADPSNGSQLATPNTTATSFSSEPAFVDDFSTSGSGFDGDKVRGQPSALPHA